MSITDELREYVRHYSVAGSSKDKTLTAIADRIDATYEEDVNTACKLANSLSADELKEHGWVKLPVDADGVPIHVGDRLDGYGKTIEVVEIRHGRSGWVVISRDGNGYADTFAFTHHRPPTVEDVLTELEGMRGNGKTYEDVVMRCADLAGILRELLAGEDE